MQWILQENICQEQKWTELISALQRFDTPYSIHKVVPFVGDLIPEPEIHSNKIWMYGSLSMGNISKKNGWSPGVIEVPDFNVQLNYWKQHLLNSDVIFKPVFWLADNLLLNDHYFIKPENDSKFIPGQVMTRHEIKEWAYNIAVLGENDGSNVNKDSIVILSSPKKVQCEARFWVVNQKVVTHSLYKLGGTIIHDRSLVDGDLSSFAHWIADNSGFCIGNGSWEPAKAYCLDLCRTMDDKVKIVEINNINSSGLYDCDVNKLVPAINGIVL